MRPTARIIPTHPQSVEMPTLITRIPVSLQHLRYDMERSFHEVPGVSVDTAPTQRTTTHTPSSPASLLLSSPSSCILKTCSVAPSQVYYMGYGLLANVCSSGYLHQQHVSTLHPDATHRVGVRPERRIDRWSMYIPAFFKSLSADDMVSMGLSSIQDVNRNGATQAHPEPTWHSIPTAHLKGDPVHPPETVLDKRAFLYAPLPPPPPKRVYCISQSPAWVTNLRRTHSAPCLALGPFEIDAKVALVADPPHEPTPRRPTPSPLFRNMFDPFVIENRCRKRTFDPPPPLPEEKKVKKIWKAIKRAFLSGCCLGR